MPSKLARVVKKTLCAGETIAAAAQNKRTSHIIAGKLNFKMLLFRLCGGREVNRPRISSFVMGDSLSRGFAILCGSDSVGTQEKAGSKVLLAVGAMAVSRPTPGNFSRDTFTISQFS